MAWPWGACGFWEGLERLESFGAFAGWQTAALKAHRKPLLWPGLGVPVGEVALALGCLFGKWPWPWGACWGRWGCSLCRLANGSFESLKKVIAVDLGGLLGTVFGGFGGFWEHLERLESFGAFAGWQTAALKAHRKPLLWPGPGVPVGEVALAPGCLLGKVGLQPLQARKRQL